MVSRRAPAFGDLIRGLGGGSGSIGIECTRRCAAVFAVERDPESCARIRRNAAAHELTGLYICEGDAADLTAGVYTVASPALDDQDPEGLDVVCVPGITAATAATATLAGFDPSGVDLHTTVIVGCSQSRIVAGRFVTPRGYRWKEWPAPACRRDRRLSRLRRLLLTCSEHATRPHGRSLLARAVLERVVHASADLENTDLESADPEYAEDLVLPDESVFEDVAARCGSVRR